MDREHFYTDEKNAQIVIALLKDHGIRQVIANPGTTNMPFVGSVQNDAWFKVYSGIDERHAGYMAVGMAAESGEPVVLSCTGATASRNYLPALTEAYYRKLPVLAITSMQRYDQVGQLYPQGIDRSVQPADVVVKSVECRIVRDAREYDFTVRLVNDAILSLKRRGGGPVHINLETEGRMVFNVESLPPVRKIRRYDVAMMDQLPGIADRTKIALHLGSGMCDPHWAEFAVSHNVAVFADESSGYYGPNRIVASLLCSQKGFRDNPEFYKLHPDLIIDAGEVSGDYYTLGFLSGIAPVWRVSPDGEIRDRFHCLENVFEMPASAFVSYYAKKVGAEISDYADAWRTADLRLREKTPNLPFSGPWIAQQLSHSVPSGSVLHLGILNSLRSWNEFPANEDVHTTSNVGGFGIDGCMSTLIGASLASPNKLCFGVLGDLAFFYDLNSLGNRHIGKNLRILVVNNGCGAEFNMFFHPGSQFGGAANDYIAAGGHFKDEERGVVRHYVESLGFEYLCAKTKEEFVKCMNHFIKDDLPVPVVFECRTSYREESAAHRSLFDMMPYVQRPTAMATVTSFVPSRVKNAIKVLVK